MIALRLTCTACPEQYDAMLDGTDIFVGYLRLRHGHFTVEYPDAWGQLVLEAEPRGDGEFVDDERDGYLNEAVCALALTMARQFKKGDVFLGDVRRDNERDNGY